VRAGGVSFPALPQFQVEELTSALGETYVEPRVWRKGGSPPSFQEMEALRREGGMHVARLLRRLGIPSSTWH